MNKKNLFLVNSVLLGIAAVAIFYFIGGIADINNAERYFKTAMEHLKQQCLSYDEILASDKAKSLIRLTEQAKEVSFDIDISKDFLNENNMKEYADEQRLTGIILIDENYNVSAECGMTGLSCKDWEKYIKKSSVRDVMEYSKKIYCDRVDLNGDVYDIAAVPRMDKKGIIFCYKYQAAEITAINQASIENLLAGYEMEMGGIVYITDGQTIRGTNDRHMRGKNISKSELINLADGIKAGELSKINTSVQCYYGGVLRYRKYNLYVFYPKREVFIMRRWFVFFVISIYMMLCFVWYILKTGTEKKHLNELKEQIDTITAISEIYTLTFLLDIKNNKISIIRAPKRLKEVIGENKSLRDAANLISNVYISDEFKDSYKKFVDFDTLSERVKNKKYTEFISRDIYNVWYRNIIIPKECDDKGNVLSAVMVTRNIDEQKKREIEYREKLKKTTLEAIKANNAKTDFLRRISHDIRTPINVIKGMNEIAGKFPDDLEKQQYCREKINQATILLLEIVNDVLSVNLLDSDNFYLDEKSFDLRTILADAYSITDVQAEDKNIDFKIERVETEHCKLIGSPVYFKQIIMNIMSNAVKYTNAGGKIVVKCNEIFCDGKNSVIRFVCTDTGIGMSQKFQMHMFEAFAREQKEIKTEYQGIGLGLAIVKKLTDKMGGKIYVKSEKGKGSEFTVEMPFKIDMKDGVYADNKIKKPISLKGIKILLVEDNEINMEIAEFMLKDKGANVTKAVNGIQAVELWNKSDTGYFDVVLMDIMMPKMNGIEAAKIIRASKRPDAKKVPIIAMSANIFEDDIKMYEDAGMNGHISKPLEIEKMIEVIYEEYKKNIKVTKYDNKTII